MGTCASNERSHEKKNNNEQSYEKKNNNKEVKSQIRSVVPKVRQSDKDKNDNKQS